MTTPIVQFHHDPKHGGHFTTVLFWECQCEEDFLHPVYHRECPPCGITRNQAPDAGMGVVVRMGTQVDERLTEAAFEQAGLDSLWIPFAEGVSQVEGA
ncbi:MAG: hypothetical protein ISR58_08415 [Anaerolineales bacterium]|nr:hypothetical protein [Chloroflexota bacterium]MBL6981202.1 hypothetical protein [Anaerolineales bacterium]